MTIKKTFIKFIDEIEQHFIKEAYKHREDWFQGITDVKFRSLWKNDKEKLQKQIEFSKTNGLIVVLKGAHTSISDPDGNVFFNTTGNPGMATAGSGDVLLGMITALLSRGYKAIESAIIGVYLHGLSGDIAAFELGLESMKAGDIIESIPEAFLSIE